MTTTTTQCDRCLQPIAPSDRDEIVIRFGKYDRHGHPIDLCSACLEYFRIKVRPKPEPTNSTLQDRLVECFTELIQDCLPTQQ